MTMRTPAILLVGLLIPCTLLGQVALLLRYRAPPGTVVRTAFHTDVSVWAFDGNRFESADYGTLKATTLEGPEGRTVVHLAFDSVNTRTLGSDGRWREFALGKVDSVWTQIGVDDRMRVLSVINGGLLSGVTGMRRILMGLPNLELPEQTLRRSDSWTSGTVVSILPGLRNESVEPTLLGTVRVVLDSIVVRARDTLGYMTFDGRFPDATYVDVIGPGRVTATGDLKGSLIWSTSWDRFVSGTSTTRVSVVRQGDEQGNEPGELRVEVTTRHQVKP
jgi:hypothetical protein